MSIGAAKNFASTAAAVFYTIFAVPSSTFKIGPSGSLTTITFVTTLTGGTGPFTFLWTQQSGGSITINSPTSPNTSFTASGSNGTRQSGVFKITVTDTGNSDLTTDDTVSVTIIFEDQT